MHINTVLWQSSVKGRHPTRSAENKSTDQNASAPRNKRELQSFSAIVNYLSKFSLGTAEVCKPLRKLTSSRTTWTWNASYQQLFDNAKSLIKTEVCMKFYDDTKALYLETDASRDQPRSSTTTTMQQHNMPKGHGTRQQNPLPNHIC